MSVCLVFVAPDKKEVVENGDHLPADSPPPDDEYQSSESSVVEGSHGNAPSLRPLLVPSVHFS